METRTTISELGEFGLIERLASTISLQHPTSIKGIGDDAAVIENNEGNSNTYFNRFIIRRYSFRFNLFSFKTFGIQGGYC